MWIDVIRSSGIYLILFFFLAICGFSVLKLFKETFIRSGFYTGLFLSLLFGLMLVTGAFSIIKTHFLTVCIFFPVVFLFTFYRKKISFGPLYSAAKSERTFLFYVTNALLLFLPFIYFSLIIFKKGSFHFNAVAYDNAMYAELSAYLADSGIENKWAMFFTDLSPIKGIEPYHYVDSWFNALSFSLFGSNPLLLFYLVTYPLLLTITLCGILAIIEQFKNVSIPELALAVFLLFLGPLYQVKLSNYHFNSMACEIPLQHFGEKFSVYYPFILLSLLLMINNYFKEAFLWLLSIAVVSSTTFPSLAVLMILIFFFLERNKDHFRLKVSLFLASYIIFFTIFSFSNESYGNGTTMLGFTDFDTKEFNYSWFKLTVSNFGYGFITSLNYFLADYFYAIPLILYFGFYEKNKTAKFMLISLFFCFFGLAAACFYYKLPDSHQLFTNTLPLFHCVLIVICIIILYRTAKSRIVTTMILIFVSLFFINTIYYSLKEYSKLDQGAGVSDGYLMQVKELISKGQKRQRIGFIYTQADHEYLKLNPDSNYLYHLSYLDINAIPFRMSIMQVNDDTFSLIARKAYQIMNRHELFYSFYLKEFKTLQNKDSIQIRFIKNNHLNYLLLGPTMDLPSFLNTGNSSIINDPKTHIRFVSLHNF